MFDNFTMAGWRNLQLMFGRNDNYSGIPGQFTAYFHYTIGRFQTGYELFFSKEPTDRQYQHYIFLRLGQYKPHDAVKYLEYHLNLYPHKKDFLLFVQRTLEFRLSHVSSPRMQDWVTVSKICLDWTIDRLREMEDDQKIHIYDEFIRDDLSKLIKEQLKELPGVGVRGPVAIEQLTDEICSTLKVQLDGIVVNTEEKIMHLADQYETGDIQIANLNLKDKLITLFLCLRSLTNKTTPRNKTGEPLFTKMDLNDIAQILRLHFAPYNGLKIDSIEKMIYEVNNRMNSDNTDYQDLYKALQKFFFK